MLPAQLNFTARHQRFVQDPNGYDTWEVVEKHVAIPADKTALVI